MTQSAAKLQPALLINLMCNLFLVTVNRSSSLWVWHDATLAWPTINRTSNSLPDQSVSRLLKTGYRNWFGSWAQAIVIQCSYFNSVLYATDLVTCLNPTATGVSNHSTKSNRARYSIHSTLLLKNAESIVTKRLIAYIDPKILIHGDTIYNLFFLMRIDEVYCQMFICTCVYIVSGREFWI